MEQLLTNSICPLTLIGSADSLKRSWMSVRIRQGVPSGFSIMDNTASFYLANRSSILLGRTSIIGLW